MSKRHQKKTEEMNEVVTCAEREKNNYKERNMTASKTQITYICVCVRVCVYVNMCMYNEESEVCKITEQNILYTDGYFELSG